MHCEMGSPNEGLNCLICNTTFDVKPTLFVESQENYGIVGEEGQETKHIKSAFILWCQLLLTKTNEAGDDVCIQLLEEMFENLFHPGGRMQQREQFGDISKNPFCNHCYQGIVEVHKLQTIINETRVLQKCILDDLKKSLISSHSSSSEGSHTSTYSGNRVRVAIRRQLIINLGSEKIPTEKSNDQESFSQKMEIKEGSRSNQCKSKKSGNLKHRKPSSRINLKRRLNFKEDDDPPAGELLSILTSDTLGVSEEAEACSKRESEIYHDSNSPSNSVNDSDWNAEEDLVPSISEDEDEEMPTSIPTREKGRRGPSKVSTRKGTKPLASHVDDTDEILTKTRDPPEPIVTRSLRRSRLQASGSQQPPLPSQSSCMNGEVGVGGKGNTLSVSKRYRSWYYIIPDKNLLLLLNSLIKYDYMQRLECLDKGCGHVVEGTSALSFEIMREHVSVRHPRNTGDRTTSQKCPFCGETVFRLKFHLKRKHQDFPKLQVLCEICWKPLKSKTPSQHLWFHKNEEEQAALTAQMANRAESCNVECKECGRKFVGRNFLLIHEKSHRKSPKLHPNVKNLESKRKSVQCKMCPSILCSNASLKVHMCRRHNVSDGHHISCSICHKKFAWKKDLEDHRRTHTNERPFVCEICGKAFTNEIILKSHATAHTSEKQFQCQFCGAEFKYIKGLKQHCRLRHAEMMLKPSEAEKKIATQFVRQEFRPDFIGPKQMFPCDFCEKVFQWKCRMKKHVRISHSSECHNFDAG